MPATLAILLAALALAGPAAAAEPRTAPPKEADLGAKRSVAPDAALGGQLEGKRKVEEAAGPKLDFETFRRTVEFDISGKRKEEIASLQKLIRLGGGSDADTPQWYFRLAELLWEESQYDFFEANRRDDRLIALGTRGDPREIDKLMAEKKELEDRCRGHQDQAVALYRAIIQKYPKYPRMDEVLYFLAENLTKRNRQDPDALKAYRSLIKNFPDSRYVPDAWMAFGEYYFERANKNDRTDNLNKALEAYRKAAEHQESSVYGYALYKQAWVHTNLGNWNEALELFRSVIFFGEMPTSTVPADRKLALVKEARKDYVRTYSHVGSAEGAWDEFRRVGGQTGWWEMVKTLAGLYFDEGKDRDAILVYHRLIQERPLSVEAPFFQSRIVTSAGRMGKKEAAVQQAKVFVKLLRDIEASPEGKDPKNDQVLKDARHSAENTLRVLAVQYHNEWKKTRDDPVAALASQVYEQYLEVFPGEPPAYEMRFFHAELLYALADFEGAADEYERVALADVAAAEGKGKPGKFFRDALENTVFARDAVAKKADAAEPRAAPDPKRAVALTPARQKLVDACERYLKWQPKGDRWVEVAYKAANLYYRHNRFGEATDLFTRVALDHPEHELAGYSTNLVLDAYNLLGDWRNVNGWAKRFYADAALIKAHPQLKDDLARVIEQSAFKVIEERERAKDWLAAAEEYQTFARDWPASKLAATSLYNASVDLVRAGRLDRAMEVREQLLARYPADPLAPRCLYDNAEAHEATADFEAAADRYERYFQEWRRARAPAPAPRRKGKAAPAPAPAPAASAWEEKKANDGIVNAAVFRAGLRQWAKAEAASLAYLEAWPEGADAPRIFLSLADLYARQGQTAKELHQLEEYQRRYARDPDEWLALQQRIADLLEKSGNAAGARRAYDLGLEHWKRNRAAVKDRGLPLVAEARYRSLEPAWAAYDKITLDVAPRYLKSQLQVKGKKLHELEVEYGEIVKLKQAEPAICALTRIGLGYRRFAQALREAPVPKELRGKKEYVEEYKAQIEQVAEPLDKKAVEGLDLAVKASRDYGVVNACAREATAILVKVEPEKYGPSPEIVPAVAVAAPDARRGYGLLADLLPPPAAAPKAAARRADAPALPALQLSQRGPRAAETAADADPQKRTIAAEPAVPRPRKKGSDDEDLLP
ncbi:MAG TPA: tetratricopeptide repeat protein [Anaeromyxobacter sp.]|nr:tetratricopeptide repeat protein [Anaeromyxobacter sp.]